MFNLLEVIEFSSLGKLVLQLTVCFLASLLHDLKKSLFFSMAYIYLYVITYIDEEPVTYVDPNFNDDDHNMDEESANADEESANADIEVVQPPTPQNPQLIVLSSDTEPEDENVEEKDIDQLNSIDGDKVNCTDETNEHGNVLQTPADTRSRKQINSTTSRSPSKQTVGSNSSNYDVDVVNSNRSSHHSGLNSNGSSHPPVDSNGLNSQSHPSTSDFVPTSHRLRYIVVDSRLRLPIYEANLIQALGIRYNIHVRAIEAKNHCAAYWFRVNKLLLTTLWSVFFGMDVRVLGNYKQTIRNFTDLKAFHFPRRLQNFGVIFLFSFLQILSDKVTDSLFNV